VPVKKAKHVASIDGGVILANRTIVGSYVYARPRVPRKTLQKIVKDKSDTPKSKFNLKTNITENMLPIIAM
jgi:hypothetical protein